MSEVKIIDNIPPDYHKALVDVVLENSFREQDPKAFRSFVNQFKELMTPEKYGVWLSRAAANKAVKPNLTFGMKVEAASQVFIFSCLDALVRSEVADFKSKPPQ